MPRFTAMERAATLLRDPVCVARLRAEPLPADVVTLLRILTGDAEAEAQAVTATGKPAATVREAAEFYVTQVLFHSTSDPYRLLGVRPDASRTDLRVNLALLLRWLHPDIAGPKHRGMAERVIKAWNDLKAPEAREAIDRGLVESRDANRRRQANLARRTGPKRPVKDTRARHQPAKAGVVTARRSKGRRRLAIAILCLAAIGGGAAAYSQSEMVSDASQFFASIYQSVESMTASAPDASDREETAATTVTPSAKPCATCAPQPRAAGSK